ncbi:MAG: hypothetical protein AB8B87_17105 [Granulosicoccus sp.]
MQPNVAVLLLVSLGSAWWIGSRFTELLPTQPNVLVENAVGRSDDLVQSAPVKVTSPFDIVETVSHKNISLTEKTNASDADSILKPVASERSLQAILAQPLTGESETALLDKLEFWSVTRPADTALWIEQTLSNAWQGSAADALRYPLLSLWVEIEPEVALAKLSAFADETEIPYLMLSHATRLADESSPSEAIEWARSIEDKASSEVIVDGLLQRWLESDVRDLATYIESDLLLLQFGFDTPENTALNDNQTGFFIPDHFKKRVATALIAQDPARALRWADALPSKVAEEVRSEVIDNWLVHDPVSAGDWLSGVLNDTGTLAVSLASTIPQHDIDLAINTLPSLSGASQSAMTVSIVETLSEIDPENARVWIDGLVDPQERSAATAVWARANAERQPAEALNGALLSTSSPSRLDTLVDVAATVARVDQPLVESWLAAAPLSDYERSQIASVVLNTDDYPFH